MDHMDPRRPRSPDRYPAAPRRILFAGAFLAVSLAACHDSPLDPLAAVTTVETVPALTVSHPIPSLAELAARVPGAGELAGPVAAWERSWAQEDGEAVRAGVRVEAAPVLYEVLGETAARSALTSLDWLASGEAGIDELPVSLEGPLREALLLRERGERALAVGKGEEALVWALAAGDRVRSVTSQAVAQRMVRRGETLLARHEAAAGDLERATHLMNGARRALAEGDHSMAIQRAFYACQVLEGRWHTDPDTGERQAPAPGPAGSGAELPGSR